MFKRVEFKPPEGLAIPEGKSDGDTFEMMATFKVKGNRLCLVAMGDHKMAGYEMMRDEGGEVASNYRKAMNGGSSDVSDYAAA